MSADPTLFDLVPDDRHGHLGEIRLVLNEDLDVEEPRARARAEDPSTSHEAAASVRQITVTQDRVLSLLRWLGAMTDEEILAAYDRRRAVTGWPPVSPSGLRSRRSELVAQGRVTADGRGKTSSGRSCQIWRAVE